MIDVLINALLVLATVIVVGLIGIVGAFFATLIVKVWPRR